MTPRLLPSRASRAAAVLVALLGWYCLRSETMRVEMSRIQTPEDFAARKNRVLWPPWRPLLAYVSIDDDVHLYYEFTRVVLGERPDAAYVQRWARDGELRPEQVAAFERQMTEKQGLRLPYRDVGLGFPPLALLLMLVPRLVASSLAAYRVAFAAILAVLYLGAWALAVRIARRAGGPCEDVLWRRAAVVTACAGPILLCRFDLLPAALVCAALWALCARRPLLSGLLLLGGAGAKLYPALLLPVWAGLLYGRGGEARRRVLPLLLPFAAAGLVAVAGLALSGRPPMALVESLATYARRPVQIESLLGAPALALGSPLRAVAGSDNVVGPVLSAVAPLLDALVVLGPVALGLLALRSPGRGERAAGAGEARGPGGAGADDAALVRRLVAFTVATVMVVLLVAKVLSPQYLIWALPLVALLPGAGGRRVFVCVCVAFGLTQIYFPFMYTLLVSRVPPVVGVVLVRNALLLATGGLALREALRPC